MVHEIPNSISNSSEPLEESILRSLRKITRAIDLHSRYLSREYHLTGPQVVCLRHLKQHGPTMPSLLAKEVSLSQATVTGILDRLEEQGAVQRERDISDRRRVNICLTEPGEELAASVPLPLQERFTMSLKELPEENQLVIDTVLKQIVGMMEAKDLEAAPMLQAGSLLDGPSESA